MLLVMSGDIESNPGPDTQDIGSMLANVQRIQTTPNDMLARITAFQNEQKSKTSSVG